VPGGAIAHPRVVHQRDEEILWFLERTRPALKKKEREGPAPEIAEEAAKLMHELLAMLGIHPGAHQNCPFHDSSGGISFSYDVHKGWYCFAEKLGGGLGLLIKKLSELNDEACQAVASRRGVPVEEVKEARKRARTESARRRAPINLGGLLEEFQDALGHPLGRVIMCGLTTCSTPPEKGALYNWAPCTGWHCLFCGAERRLLWVADLAPKIEKEDNLFHQVIPSGQLNEALKRNLRRLGATYRWWRTTAGGVSCIEVVSTHPLCPEATAVPKADRQRLIVQILKTIRRRGPKGENLVGGSRLWKPPPRPKKKESEDFAGITSQPPSRCEATARMLGLETDRMASVRGPDGQEHAATVHVDVNDPRRLDYLLGRTGVKHPSALRIRKGNAEGRGA
jgi:hypothetical protein